MEAILYNRHELRPCMVKVYTRKHAEKKALFHKFITRAQPIPPAIMQGGHPGGQVIATYALIELEDGTVYEVEPSDIRFLDTKGLMDQYAWGDESVEEGRNCFNCKHGDTSIFRSPCRECNRESGSPDKWEANDSNDPGRRTSAESITLS